MRLLLKLIVALFAVLLTILVAVLLFLFSLSSFFLMTTSAIVALLGVELFFLGYLVQRILSNWQFDLPIFLIALLPKPRHSHRYACVWEAALSEKYSASNYPKLNFHCTSWGSLAYPVIASSCPSYSETRSMHRSIWKCVSSS